MTSERGWTKARMEANRLTRDTSMADAIIETVNDEKRRFC